MEAVGSHLLTLHSHSDTLGAKLAQLQIAPPYSPQAATSYLGSLISRFTLKASWTLRPTFALANERSKRFHVRNMPLCTAQGNPSREEHIKSSSKAHYHCQIPKGYLGCQSTPPQYFILSYQLGMEGLAMIKGAKVEGERCQVVVTVHSAVLFHLASMY